MKIYLGDKFYNYNEETDKINTIRITKIKETTFSYITEEGSKSSISKEHLLLNFTRLKPDATIAFTIVNLEQNLKDVIVATYRTKDLNEGDTIPYATCRQNIFDMFTNQVQKGKTMFVGVSVSKDTIPDDTPFEMTLACNGIDYTNHISAYMDDTLDTILSFVNRSKFDLVLSTIYNNVTNKDVQGYCSTLKQLLTENDFMYDFQYGFNIHRVGFEVEVEDEYELNDNQRLILEDIFKVEMFKTYVIPYSKEIDMKAIKREHVIICDKNSNIFIIAYDKGEYINRAYAQNIKDKRDAVALLKYKKINK